MELTARAFLALQNRRPGVCYKLRSELCTSIIASRRTRARAVSSLANQVETKRYSLIETSGLQRWIAKMLEVALRLRSSDRVVQLSKAVLRTCVGCR